MRFRPCIDIHNGKVKQIVGGSLKDGTGGSDSVSTASENFVSEHGADHFATLYKEHDLFGGHVILLNKAGTPEYEATKAEAFKALGAYRSGLSVGGGITTDNAREFLDAGAYAVIVTSYVFRDGIIDYERLDALRNTVGREHIILDLSCRRRDDAYYIVTDRWQKFTPDTIMRQLTVQEREALMADMRSFDEPEVIDIYHGSPKVIEQPVFGEGKVHNDYGRGFYCTEHAELAKE